MKAQERIEAQKKVRPAALVYRVYESCDCHVTSVDHLQEYEAKLEELERAMVQRSAKEEDSLVSQRQEYEKVLSQQRRLYDDKMTELEQLHTQRKVSGRESCTLNCVL